MNARLVSGAVHDYLAPKLDTYEQAIYLYVLRHIRLLSVPAGSGLANR